MIAPAVPETVVELCLLGNEAVARGALEAGVEGVFAYPGTPSTEISMSFYNLQRGVSDNSPRSIDPLGEALPPYFEFSINEKVAMEKAIAFSIGHRPTLCCMKNVGLNVASDPLLNIPYQVLGAALVVVVCDDPGCHSSSNEQDSRHWAEAAKVPLFDVGSPAEACDMTREAFTLSTALRLPVLVRLTTRVCHGRATFHGRALPRPSGQGHFDRLPQHVNVPGRNSLSHRLLLERLADDAVIPFNQRHSRIVAEPPTASHGVIVAGVSASYVLEQARDLDLAQDLAVLKIGLIHPFPADTVATFLQRFERVLVVEELDPVIENQVRLTAQKRACPGNIFGKGDFGLESVGEFSPAIIRQALCALTGHTDPATGSALPGVADWAAELPERPPTMCAGCPHRATYYGLKLALSQQRDDAILCGDIGCLGLGALPPLRMMDTLHHMGMSLSMAQGLDAALADDSDDRRRIVALLGDGTFFHSGIPALINAVYTRARMTVIIFDNRAIAMTGGQPHPGADATNLFREVAIEPLVRGLGVECIITMDPLDLDQTCAAIQQAMVFDGVSVLVSKSPCLMLASMASAPRRRPVTVDPTRCRHCDNHDDPGLHCSQNTNNGSGLARARGNRLARHRIEAHSQQCPANICNHGFFNAIVAGDYQAALEIVRDKMIFAAACGEICHRPCEGTKSDLVPIRQLKAFVSSIAEHQGNLANVQQRVVMAEKQPYRVAVVGAGPAGLSAAYDLVQAGYTVTVLEKDAEIGGLLTHVIPDYRLDKRRYQQEAGLLEKLGVEIQRNTALGRDVSLAQLASTHDAVILASGLDQAISLPVVENALPPDHWYFANDFLRRFNSNTLELAPGLTVLVVGGGNSAMDAARAAQRHPAVERVIVSCIERAEKMPAFAEEIEAVHAAGIEVLDNSEIGHCESAEGGCWIQLDQAGGGRQLTRVKTGCVVIAIGQMASPLTTGTRQALSCAANGRLREAPDAVPGRVAGSTSSNVFVAGDLGATNHQSLIGAIGSGKRTATGVRQLLEERPYPYEGEQALAALHREMPAQRPRTSALHPLATDPDRGRRALLDFALVQACARCSHCIDDFGCPSLVPKNGQITIDQVTCTGCGLCIEVCPNGAIHAALESPASPERDN